MVWKVAFVVVVFILFFVVLVFKTDFDPTRQNNVVNWLWLRPIKGVHMYSRFSRCITARGSCTGLVTVGPTKV